MAEDKPASASLRQAADAGVDAPSMASSASVPKAAAKDDQKIPLSRKIIFSAPTVATLPFIAMWGMHGNKNYQAFGASLAMISLFTALARSLDVVSDPLMSYWTDSASFGFLPKWLRGRRKPFMFFGCFLYSGLLAALLNPPYAEQTRLSMYFGIFYTLYFLSNTLTTIPYDALAPELSEDSKERTGLFFIANLFDGVGTLFALVIPIVMTGFAENYTDRNSEICKEDTALAAMCIAGRTCGGFLDKGFSGAYEANSTLSSLMQNRKIGDVKEPEDITRHCLSWVRSQKVEDTIFPTSSLMADSQWRLQNNEFCNCVGACSDACNVANKRTGFMLVGFIFAAWMVCTMVLAVVRVPERKPAEERPKAPPIVPSMRSALNNRLFRVLLPAWTCDAFVTAIGQSLVPYFVEAVVAPAYQTMEEHGRDCVGEAGRKGSPMYSRLCETDDVIAICGLLALCTAILVLPLWNFLVSRIGKVRTWFLWSLSMALSNVLFLFVWKGGVYFLFFCAALNGAPLGAKFLADAILADIIDYDEFLTGMRSEATYFMFKSFLPKIVQIPASAIPIALLNSFGYVDPVGGRVQDQPASVSNYIRFVVGCGFICSVGAYFLKTRYPLRSEQVDKLREAIQEHKQGNVALDPVSGRQYKPMTIANDSEQEVFWLFNHFDMSTLDHAFLLHPDHRSEDNPLTKFQVGCNYLVSKTTYHLSITLSLLIAAIGGTAGSVQLLSSAKWQFVPTLLVVAIGLGISSSVFSSLRFRAARQLRTIAEKCDTNHQLYQHRVQRLLEEQKLIALLGQKSDEPSSSVAQMFSPMAAMLGTDPPRGEQRAVQGASASPEWAEPRAQAVKKVQADDPGSYRIVHEPCQVRKGKSKSSQHVAYLRKGMVVEVLEVAKIKEEQRVRGRLAKPEGWISLADTRSGARWAVKEEAKEADKPAVAPLLLPPRRAEEMSSAPAPLPVPGQRDQAMISPAASYEARPDPPGVFFDKLPGSIEVLAPSTPMPGIGGESVAAPIETPPTHSQKVEEDAVSPWHSPRSEDEESC